MISTLVIARVEPLVILGWICNTCGETLVGNTPKIRCLQAGHSQALINPAQ